MTKLKSHPDILADRDLHILQTLLGIHEITGHWVLHQRIPRRFKILDLVLSQLQTSILLLMQLLAPLVQALIHQARRIIGQKLLHFLKETLVFRISRDGGAKLFGLGHHVGIVSE